MSPRRSRLVFLALTASAVGVATLTPAGSGVMGVSSSLCIFCGDRGLADFLSNVLLFAPFGAAVGLFTRSPLAAAATGLLFSLGIEAAQVTVVAGRDANIGDLVANGFGTLAGWWLCRTQAWWFTRDATWKRAFALTTGMLIVILTGLSLMAPSLPQRPYYLQWTARFDGMRPYDGRVLSTRVGEVMLPGPWEIDASERVRDLLTAGAPLAFSVVAGSSSAGTAPIVSIFDDWQREIVLIGADGVDLIYRYRTRGEELRLDRGELRIAGVLRDVSAGTALQIAVRKQRNVYCVKVESTETCGVGFTVADTWMLLTSPALSSHQRTIAGMLWLFCLFVPPGVLVATRRSAIVLSAVIVIVLAGGPYVIGFGWTPPYQVGAACAGLVGGLLWRTFLARRRPDSSVQTTSVTTARHPHRADQELQRLL